MKDVGNQLLYTLNQSGTFLQISAFVVGTYEELDLRYLEENREFHLLDDKNCTIGYGFDAKAKGELRLSTVGAEGELYIYAKK